MTDRSGSSGGSLLAQAVAAQFDPVGVVDDAIEDGVSESGIAEHPEMPQHLTVESLGSGWLIRITRCMAGVIRSANDAQGGDWR